MGNIHTVGPNEALIVSGGCCGSRSKVFRVGGWAWAWWLVTDVQRLSLEVSAIVNADIIKAMQWQSLKLE
jgi:flotillin